MSIFISWLRSVEGDFPTVSDITLDARFIQNLYYKEIGMRKTKKLLGIALVPCMVGSLLAGCTASSENVDTTPSSSAEAEASTDASAEASDDETEATEASEPEETKEPETQGSGDASGAAFIDVLKGISDMESYTMNSSVSLNQKTTVDGETENADVTFGVKSLTDGKGNVSVTISADYEDADTGIALSGDLLTISKVDDRMYIDLSSLWDTVMDYLGEESAYVEQYLSAFEVSMDELESLLVLGIPVGDLAFSKDDYAKMEDALDLIYDDMAAAIDELGEDFMTQNGNTYTITVDNDNLIDIVDAMLSAFEGNIGDIYDAYVAGMKETDYSVYLESVISAVVDEVVEGIEAASETEISEDQRAELEAEIQSAIEQYQSMMEESIAEFESSRDAFVEEFNSAVKEFNDGKEEAQKAIDEGDASVSAVMAVTVDGEKGSRKVTSELTANAEYVQTLEGSDDTAAEVSISVVVKSTIEEGNVEITAPEEYASLSKAIEVAYKVYMLYQEMAEEGQGGGIDPGLGGDDYDFDYDSYTQAELEKNYGVSLKKDQALVCDTLDNDGVLVTAYDGMEFFQPDDTSGMLMESNEDASAFITIYVYDTSFDEAFYTEYYTQNYDAEKLEENLYYFESKEQIILVSFAENITIEISVDTETEDLMQDMTGGDNEEFLRGLLELCEIVPAA